MKMVLSEFELKIAWYHYNIENFQSFFTLFECHYNQGCCWEANKTQFRWFAVLRIRAHHVGAVCQEFDRFEHVDQRTNCICQWISRWMSCESRSVVESMNNSVSTSNVWHVFCDFRNKIKLLMNGWLKILNHGDRKE